MEIGYENIPMYKLVLHVLQILFSLICWILEIAVFRADKAHVEGKNGWTFGVCFLSVPAWIYLIGAPRFPRTRKLAEPHAMVAVDALYTILWLSAFATQASYNTANHCGTACNLSKAIVGLAFFVCIFFAGTTTLSVFSLRYYQFNHRLPGYKTGPSVGLQNIDPDKESFNPNMAPQDEEYAPVNMNDQDHDHNLHHGGGGDYGRYDDHTTTYGGSSQTADPYGHPNDGRSDNPFEDNTEYRPTSSSVGPSAYAPPTAHDEYEDSGPAKFPAANYHR